MGVDVQKPDESLLVANQKQMWVYADVYESDLALVRSGLEVEISGDALGGEILKSKVWSVDKIVDPVTRTAKARILIQKPAVQLLPQTFVDVTIKAPLGVQIYIPSDAVLNSGTKAIVYVADDKNQFELREVKVAGFAGDKVAIASGLQEGERVVVGAVFMIDSESRLRGDKAAPKPVCPANEEWDVGMSMCMPKVSQ
jgi:Cu(I)/Ag(I) efflux system membrane fusion protein